MPAPFSFENLSVQARKELAHALVYEPLSSGVASGQRLGLTNEDIAEEIANVVNEYDLGSRVKRLSED